MFERPTSRQESTKTAGIRISRRQFLKGAGALAGTVLLDGALNTAEAGKKASLREWYEGHHARMRYDELSSLSSEEREAIIEYECMVYGKILRSEYGKRILESGTDEEIGLLLGCMPALLHSHIRGTKFDVPPDMSPAVAIGRHFDSSGLPDFRDIRFGPEDIKDFYNGNAFPVSSEYAITNWHVVDQSVEHVAEQNGKEIGEVVYGFTEIQDGIDAVVVPLPSGYELNTTPSLGFPVLTDEDIQGRLVVMNGFDPDMTAGDVGMKVRPAVAIKVTERLLEYMNVQATPKALKSFIYFLPPGESQEQGDGTVLAQGTSGSPILHDGAVVGINHACIQFTDRLSGTCIDVGFFHGPDVLNRIISENVMYIPPETHLADSQGVY